MPSNAFMKLGEIKGNSRDEFHKDWVVVELATLPIHRTMPEGRHGGQRVQGAPTLGNVLVTRQLDKSSPPLLLACLHAATFDFVELHFCTQIEGRARPYLKIKLGDVILQSYNVTCQAGEHAPIPTENISLNYASIEYTFVELNDQTGQVRNQVMAAYEIGTAR